MTLESISHYYIHQPWYNSAAGPGWSAPARFPSALRDRLAVGCTIVAASDIDSLVREGNYPECKLVDERKGRCKRQRHHCKVCQAACKLTAAHTAVAKAWCKLAYVTKPFLEVMTAGARTKVSSGEAGRFSFSVYLGLDKSILSAPKIPTIVWRMKQNWQCTGSNRC